MSDLPEQIWAKATTWGDGTPLCGDWNYCDVGHTDDREYVRADTVQAQIDAGRDAALQETLCAIKDHADEVRDNNLYDEGWQAAVRSMEQTILALIRKGDQP